LRNDDDDDDDDDDNNNNNNNNNYHRVPCACVHACVRASCALQC
jgi:hypothetical protein